MLLVLASAAALPPPPPSDYGLTHQGFPWWAALIVGIAIGILLSGAFSKTLIMFVGGQRSRPGTALMQHVQEQQRDYAMNSAAEMIQRPASIGRFPRPEGSFYMHITFSIENSKLNELKNIAGKLVPATLREEGCIHFHISMDAKSVSIARI